MGAGPSGPVFIRDPDHLKLPLEELYATEANGFSDLIEAELQQLEWRDLTIWRFPLWWFGLPAPPKGWVDRVFAMGRTYGGGHIYETGVFRGKRALLSLTTGGPGPGDGTPQRPHRIHGHRGDVVRRSPGWACTIIGGVLEQECNALFEGRAG